MIASNSFEMSTNASAVPAGFSPDHAPSENSSVRIPVYSEDYFLTTHTSNGIERQNSRQFCLTGRLFIGIVFA